MRELLGSLVRAREHEGELGVGLRGGDFGLEAGALTRLPGGVGVALAAVNVLALASNFVFHFKLLLGK